MILIPILNLIRPHLVLLRFYIFDGNGIKIVVHVHFRWLVGKCYLRHGVDAAMGVFGAVEEDALPRPRAGADLGVPPLKSGRTLRVRRKVQLHARANFAQLSLN